LPEKVRATILFESPDKTGDTRSGQCEDDSDKVRKGTRAGADDVPDPGEEDKVKSQEDNRNGDIRNPPREN